MMIVSTRITSLHSHAGFILGTVHQTGNDFMLSRRSTIRSPKRIKKGCSTENEREAPSYC
jgi:hypothetical protein